MILEIKIGALKDGTVVAFQGVIYDEQGAYASLGPRFRPREDLTCIPWL